jgi:hypothetical protein
VKSDAFVPVDSET